MYLKLIPRVLPTVHRQLMVRRDHLVHFAVAYKTCLTCLQNSCVTDDHGYILFVVITIPSFPHL
jgi:hypothetical protein